MIGELCFFWIVPRTRPASEFHSTWSPTLKSCATRVISSAVILVFHFSELALQKDFQLSIWLPSQLCRIPPFSCAYFYWRIPVGYFKPFRLPLKSMRRGISARPKKHATHLLHEPNRPPRNRWGALVFPKAGKPEWQSLRACCSTEAGSYYGSFSCCALLASPQARCRARNGKTPSRNELSPSRQCQPLSKLFGFSP